MRPQSPVLATALGSPMAALNDSDAQVRAALAGGTGFVFLDGKADNDALPKLAAALPKPGPLLPDCS